MQPLHSPPRSKLSRSIVPHCPPRRAQNVKTRLLTGRTIPLFARLVAPQRPYSTYQKSRCIRSHGDGLFPTISRKAPPGRDCGQQWVAATPGGGIQTPGKGAHAGERAKLNRTLAPDVHAELHRESTRVLRGEEHAMRDSTGADHHHPPTHHPRKEHRMRDTTGPDRHHPHHPPPHHGRSTPCAASTGPDPSKALLASVRLLPVIAGPAERDASATTAPTAPHTAITRAGE